MLDTPSYPGGAGDETAQYDGGMDGRALVGRERELQLASLVLGEAMGGEAQAVVVRGPAGIGKSAYLRVVAASANGFRVVRIAGHPAESEIPYAGVAQVRTALGEPDPLTATADPLATATALLRLIAASAPLLLIVDDAQWLDPASRRALVFATRRLDADAVCVIFGERTDGEETAELAGLGRALDLTPLSDDAATELLRRIAPDAAALVVRRLVAHAAGVPLTLTEIPVDLAPAQLSGAAPLPRELPLGGQLGRLFDRRIGALSDIARLALLALCFDPVPRSEWGRLLARLDVSPSDTDPAERAGLIDLTGETQAFAHPSIPAAVRRAARRTEVATVHAALAAHFAPDPLRHAFHLRRVDDQDPAVVRRALVAAAEHAASRDGLAEAGDLFEQAARLADPPDGELLRRAVDACTRAGAGPAAERLLIELAERTPDATERARLGAARAYVSMWTRAVPPPDTAELLSLGLGLLPGPAQEEGRQLVTALATTSFGAARYRDAHEMCRQLDAGLTGALSLDESLIADVAAVMVGAASAGQVLRGDWPDRYPWHRMATGMTPVPFAAFVLVWLGELDHAEDVVRRHTAAGSAPTAEGTYLSGTVAALVARARGEWDRADHEFEALERFVIETDSIGPYPFIALHHAHLLASRGQSAASDDLRERARRRTPVWTQMMDHLSHRVAGHARLIERDFAAAATHLAASSALEQQVGLVPSGYLTAFTDRYEAAWHLGTSSELAEDLNRYERAAEAVHHEEMRALALRCRALEASHRSAPRARADTLFAEAVERLDDVSAFEAARTRLLWGQVLRRAKRKADAVAQLAQAEIAFAQLGCSMLRETTRGELAACGRRQAAVGAAGSLVAQLTPREFEVAREVAAGASNADAARRLFISERTVEFHLSRVFRKLQLAGRGELAGVLGDPT